MIDLIKRLEAATEGSRELDRLVGGAAGAEMGWSGDVVGLGYRNYTTSLDAALTLVPEGKDWLCGTGNRTIQRPPWACITPDKEGSDTLGYGATVPLALCIAALKARNEGEGRA